MLVFSFFFTLREEDENDGRNVDNEDDLSQVQNMMKQNLALSPPRYQYKTGEKEVQSPGEPIICR